MEENDILIAESEETKKPKRRRKNINLDERNGPKAEPENVEVKKRTTGKPKKLEPDNNGLIRVRGRAEQNTFAIMEIHEGHPGGKLKVKGTEEADAWPTRRVMEAIHTGRLERV